MLTGFCFAVAKVLVPFQHINTLQLSGPVHSTLLCSKRGGGFLVLWIYQSKFGFIHEPWIKFPAWVSMMTPWHHSTCWLLVYMLMILMFFFNCNEKPKVQYLNVAKTNLVYCEQHASIFQYVLPAFNAVWVTGVFLLRLMFLCEDTFDVAHLHRLVPEQHMQKHCSCPLHVMLFLF